MKTEKRGIFMIPRFSLWDRFTSNKANVFSYTILFVSKPTLHNPPYPIWLDYSPGQPIQ